jgi:hypothetical protein
MSDLRSDAFQRALDEAGRKERAPDGEAGATGGARVSGVAFGAPPSSGGEARFGLALDWTDEPADRLAPPQAPPYEPPARSGDTSREIATELGFSTALTLEHMTSRWRDFVWRNHPDRQPVDARERANTRMAIANALYDQARRELSSRAKGSGARPNKLL